jgi:DNA modification methylase
MIYYQQGGATIHNGNCLDVLKTLPDESVHCCVTSPPYWGLRDYGHDDQIGLESTPEEYVSQMVAVFREVRRVLRDDGTMWLNLGDSYGGAKGDTLTGFGRSVKNEGRGGLVAGGRVTKCSSLKPKDLVGIPWRVAFALQADGWYLRQDIIWHKPNPMPESVRDRCTKAHEYVFLMAKSERYFYDADAIAEPAVYAGTEQSFSSPYKNAGRGSGKQASGNEKEGAQPITLGDTRNRRSVWSVSTKPYAGAHFAVMPPDLVEPCIKAGCPVGGTVLDPFNGSATVGLVALQLQRQYLGIELNPEYCELSVKRISMEARQKRLFGEAS